MYGWPEMHNKRRTETLIAKLATHSHLPWIVGGDLNEIFYNSEKRGGPRKPQAHIDAFRNAFLDHGLYDVGFAGYEYTWSRWHNGRVVVEERLDRFCATTEWSLLFSEANVTHIDLDSSDHFPIFLRCCLTRGRGRHYPARFRFQNMWLSDPSCRDVIFDAWTRASGTEAVENLMVKFDGCSKDLLKWNKTSFGYVGLEISKLEVLLKSTRDVEVRWEALSKLREWRQKEEILWWQRARADFLKFGDANTHWFHSRANLRRVQNRIAKLHDSNGDIQTDVDAVAHIAVEYFRQLFSGATSLAMEEVLDCVQPCVTDGINAQLCLSYSRVEVE